MMFDAAIYNDEFFEWHVIYAKEYSILNMDWFIDEYKPTSVIDFGCGIGSYLESAYNKGILILRGYDIGKAAKKFTPKELHQFIRYRDCTKPIDAGKFDCVISIETIEHIDPAGTDQFLSNLVNACGKYLLFTGAPPEQGGLGHINCQPKDFWISEITKLGLKYNEAVTEHVKVNWKRLGCPFYIDNNLIVFENV